VIRGVGEGWLQILRMLFWNHVMADPDRHGGFPQGLLTKILHDFLSTAQREDVESRKAQNRFLFENGKPLRLSIVPRWSESRKGLPKTAKQISV
jgi:hypothetical protein